MLYFKLPGTPEYVQTVTVNNLGTLPSLSFSAALSAGPLRIQSTAEGFKLYCSLKYYISFLKTIWHFK